MRAATEPKRSGATCWAGFRQEAVDRLRAGDAGTPALLLLEAASRTKDGAIFGVGPGARTGIELSESLHATTSVLAREGVRPGDVVLLAMRPGPELLVTLLAVLRLGAVASAAEPGTGPALFRSRMELLRPRFVVGESLFYAAARGPLRRLLAWKHLEIPDIGSVGTRHIVRGPWLPGVPAGTRRWSRAEVDPSGPADDLGLPALDPSAPALVVFTSGTTGQPKGVQHSGRSICATLAALVDHLSLGTEDVVYDRASYNTVASLISGAVVRPPRYRLVPRRWLRDVRRLGVTATFLRPADAFRIVRYCEDSGERFPESLRSVHLYSAPVTRRLLKRAHDVAGPGLRITSVYGMTEAVPVAWIDSRERLEWNGPGDLVGHPLPGIETRISPDGTLMLRGPNVHLGYMGRRPMEWHDSRDLAELRSDGRVVLLGRAKDMLIRDGFNIYPGLYEDRIARIPGVAECAMVGVPHHESGDERVVLFVAPEPTASQGHDDGLVRRVRSGMERGPGRIHPLARPDDIHLLAEIPRTRRRKIDRNRLREMAARRVPRWAGRPGPSRQADSGAREHWVVVPCFNEEAWIGDTIDALGAQTETDFRLLIVDNGSTDGTREAVDRALVRNPHLDATILEEPRKGTGWAADTGFRHAIGMGASIVFRTDADCLPVPTWFAELRRAMVEGELDAAGGRLKVRSDDVSLNWIQLLPSRSLMPLVPLLGRLLPSNRDPSYLAPYHMLAGPNTAVRAQAYLDCGGYPRETFDRESLDKRFANALRRVTPRIATVRGAVVLYSERRTEAWGVVGVIRWLLRRGGPSPEVTDIR